jgi:phosphoribosylanthranilate isomerase
MKVKICGITNLEDAIAAVNAGADMLGFNFYAGSPRCITVETCSEIVHALPKNGLSMVGVFVNATLDEINRVMQVCQLDLAQLSGDEPPELLTGLGGRGYKALRPADETGLRANIEYYPARNSAPVWLIDAHKPGVYGGTGQSADWRLAASLAACAPILLAGGLQPENVAAAITQVRPWGVDVASGVETRPGNKDHAKMATFIQNAKTAL